MAIFKLVKFTAGYLKSQKKLVYTCFILAVFGAMLAALVPLIYGRLFDFVISGQIDYLKIFLSLALWLVLALVSSWVDRFISHQGIKIGGRAYSEFCCDLYGHYLKLPFAFHLDNSTGEQTSRIDRAGTSLWDLISNIVFSFLPDILSTIVALVLMCFLQWQLSLILFLAMVLYIWATFVKTKPIIKEQNKVNKFFEKLSFKVYDVLSNINLVKHSVAEKLEVGRIKVKTDRAVEQEARLLGVWRTLSAWQSTIRTFTFVIIFSVGLFLVAQKQMTPGVLVSFFGYINLVFQPFGRLADSYQRLQKGVVTISRAEKLLQKEIEDQSGQKRENVKGDFVFHNVSFSYNGNKKKALSSVSFKVEAGQTIALVGRSGAGKTTLVNFISRYYSPKSGHILLDDLDLQEWNLESLRKQMAVVSQDISLFNDTLVSNLTYNLGKVSKVRIRQVLKEANAWEFVERLPKKEKSIIGERGVKLSGGERQRVAIAMALLRNPKILILDEATSSLDSKTEKLIQEALSRLFEDRTTFVIAHRLSTIVHADKILVFKKGKLVEEGSHKDLLKFNGEYRSLYDKQKF